jgi:cold shock CspA family protein
MVAVRDAFDSVRRQLEEAVREARGDVKVHAPVVHRTVARLDLREGFGFIATADGREVYFSRDNVVHPSFENLAPGVEVQFIEEPAGEGIQARRVSAGKHHVEA